MSGRLDGRSLETLSLSNRNKMPLGVKTQRRTISLVGPYLETIGSEVTY